MENKIIGIDIDDVLSETVYSLIKYFNEVHLFDVSYDKFLDYKVHEQDFFKKRNISKIQIHDMWNDFFYSEYGKNLNKVLGSKKSLKILKENGYKIHLITARWEELQLATHEWIKKEFEDIEIEKIHFVGSYSGTGIKKSEICNKHGIKIMIDDNHENCIDLSENNIKSFLITRPWNRHYNEKDNHPHVTRVNSWEEIINNLS